MEQATAIIQNDTLVLPERLRQVWRDAPVYITGEKDTIVIKWLQAPSFGKMLDDLNDIGRDMPSSLLDEALQSTRRA